MNRTFHALAAASLSAVLGACPAQAGITISSLVVEGDDVPGVGQVTSVTGIAVNNSGDWLVEADTNHANTDADGVVIRNGVLFAREDDPVAAPAGAGINGFDSININNAGHTGWNLTLTNQPAASDAGIYYNHTLIFQEGFISNAPQFSPNTPYIGFFEVRMNSANRLLVVASVDDPLIASTVDRALVLVDYNPKTGGFTETVLSKEADGLPGIDDAVVVDFGTGPGNIALTDNGGVMFVASLTGTTATNGAIYINDTLVARKGDPSPIAGRNYTTIGTSTPVHVNSKGDSVFRTNISGDTTSDVVIVSNGQIVAQEGSAPPDVGGGVTLTGFGSGGVKIADDGDVVWYGTWTGDTETNQGLFKGNQLLVQKGHTTIDGMVVTTVAGTTATGGIGEGFDISADGSRIIFRAVLEGGIVGAFLIELDLAQPCPADVVDDGNVNVLDLLAVISNWGGGPGNPADVNGDGTVGVLDLLAVISAWGPCP